ncbi:hypothetical protein LCGC14_1995340 [marine sediment metagenome]|uniref:Uncharacterized protein n=1 Tax=marine sediment metagenome TaxID=412755 RepID=A0A0F9F4P7_9ZZZZ
MEQIRSRKHIEWRICYRIARQELGDRPIKGIHKGLHFAQFYCPRLLQVARRIAAVEVAES